MDGSLSGRRLYRYCSSSSLDPEQNSIFKDYLNCSPYMHLNDGRTHHVHGLLTQGPPSHSQLSKSQLSNQAIAALQPPRQGNECFWRDFRGLPQHSIQADCILEPRLFFSLFRLGRISHMAVVCNTPLRHAPHDPCRPAKNVLCIKERDCPSSPKSAPLDGNQSFTSHFRGHSRARCEVCKLPKGGDAWPEDAAGF